MGKNPEPGVEDFYERHWPHFVQWWQGDDAHAIHFGMHVKGVHSFLESLHYMNYYAGRLLGLTEEKSWVILELVAKGQVPFYSTGSVACPG